MNASIEILLMTVCLMTAQIVAAQPNSFCGFNSEIFKVTDSDFKNDSSNSLGVTGGSLSLHHVEMDDENGKYSFGLNLGRNTYSFEKSNPWRGLDHSKLEEDVNEVSAFFVHEKKLSNNWSLLDMLYVRSGYSTESSISDGLTWGTVLAGKYQQSETLSYVLGVAYLSRIEESDLFIPMIGVEWQISDRLRLDGMLGLELVYDVLGSGRSQLGVGVDYEMNGFALEKEATEGVESAIRPEGVGVYLSYTHALTDSISFTAKVSSYGEQEYQKMVDNKKVSSFKTDSSMFYGIGMNVVF